MLECLEGTHFVDVFQRSLHVQSSDILECLEGTHYMWTFARGRCMCNAETSLNAEKN